MDSFLENSLDSEISMKKKTKVRISQEESIRYQ